MLHQKAVSEPYTTGGSESNHVGEGNKMKTVIAFSLYTLFLLSTGVCPSRYVISREEAVAFRLRTDLYIYSLLLSSLFYIHARYHTLLHRYAKWIHSL